jgi:hypothetical protein
LIPNFTHSGVLPPFTPADYPQNPDGISPYKTSLREFVERFLTSDERKKILGGFLTYRNELKKLGIKEGFQWIDGSFIEDIERNQQRPPKDLDIITFAYRPISIKTDNEWKKFIETNKDLFHPGVTKTNFKCDAYYVDLNLPSHVIVKMSSYWFGVFSHQRETYLWKGVIEIPLFDNEEEVMEYLSKGGSDAS